MRHWILALGVCTIGACGVEPTPSGEAPADPLDTASDPVVAPEPCVDPQLCLFEGTNAFASGTVQRDVEVRLPADPIGAPVVFVWHFLGGSADELLDWMELQDLADDGYLVVAPESRQVPFTEWQVDGDPESNPDVALFDELRERLAAQYAVDLERVYATGFSAGGLFTTYLTMNRADMLTATAPFSGGAPSYAYDTPATELPVLIAWGGQSDWYGGFDFAAASENFAAELVADGHQVVTCEHSLGHYLPPAAGSQVKAFFDDHGGTPEHRWADEPERVPGGCELVDP